MKSLLILTIASFIFARDPNEKVNLYKIHAGTFQVELLQNDIDHAQCLKTRKTRYEADGPNRFNTSDKKVKWAYACLTAARLVSWQSKLDKANRTPTGSDQNIENIGQ